MTLFQAEPSANAPWTSTTVGFGVSGVSAEAPVEANAAPPKAAAKTALCVNDRIGISSRFELAGASRGRSADCNVATVRYKTNRDKSAKTIDTTNGLFQMDRLACMRAFVRAVDLGSISAAAGELDLSSQLAGKQIRVLEQGLGI